ARERRRFRAPNAGWPVEAGQQEPSANDARARGVACRELTGGVSPWRVTNERGRRACRRPTKLDTARSRRRGSGVLEGAAARRVAGRRVAEEGGSPCIDHAAHGGGDALDGILVGLVGDVQEAGEARL